MRIRSIIKGRRYRLFVRLVANGMCQAILTIALALLIRLTFDRFITLDGPHPSNMVIFVGCGLVMIAFCTSWLRIRERIDSEQLGQDYIHRIRLDLFKHLTKLAPRALQKKGRGSLVLRFIGDLNAIKRWVSLGLARITVAGVTMAGTMAAMFVLNWVMASAFALVVALGVACILRLGKQIQATVKEGRRRRAFLATNVNEKIASMAVVQVFGQSVREQRQLRRHSNRLKKAMVARAAKIGRLRAIVQSTTILATGVVLLLGIYEIRAQHISPGTVVAVLTVVGLLIPALRGLGRVYEYWHDAQISSKKIRQFLKTPTLITEAVKAPDLKTGNGRLEFSGISLLGVLKKVTIAAEPGKVIGITGPNGAGKSTLLMLAARLIDPDEGKVLINGQNLMCHSISSVRRTVGMVSPDLPLLRGKIGKNLRYRFPDAPAEEIKRIKTLCEIDNILSDLPQGDQTRLTEGGLNLSLGQRQRIELARALMGNPEILLLDEPDAHLDHWAGALLDKILTEFQGTVLTITHNPQRLAQVDIIWRIDNGRLVEAGPPDKILRHISCNKSKKKKKIYA